MIRKWSDVQAQYQRWSSLGPAYAGIHSLIARVAAGQLSTKLHCWLSMHDLCIVQTEVSHPYSGPLLRISPLASGSIEFRYEDTFIRERQWHRHVAPEEASRQLTAFLTRLHWLASGHELAPDQPPGAGV